MEIHYDGFINPFLLLPILQILSYVIYFLLMKWVARLVFKLKVKFFRAISIEILVTVVFSAFIWICSLMGTGLEDYTFVNPVLLVVFLFSGAPFYAWLVRDTDGKPIGKKRGILLSLAVGVAKLPLLIEIGPPS